MEARGEIMKTITATVALALLPTIAFAQTAPDFSGSYFCKATASGGLALNDQQKWESTRFDVSDVAYLVTAEKTGRTEPDATFRLATPTYKITIKDFGSPKDARACFAARRASIISNDIRVDDTGYGTCIFMGYDYEFNFKSLRMQVTFRGGFMDNWRDSTEAPFITVALCEKIS